MPSMCSCVATVLPARKLTALEEVTVARKRLGLLWAEAQEAEGALGEVLSGDLSARQRFGVVG
jgi:hypothetical protein